MEQDTGIIRCRFCHLEFSGNDKKEKWDALRTHVFGAHVQQFKKEEGEWVARMKSQGVPK